MKVARNVGKELTSRNNKPISFWCIHIFDIHIDATSHNHAECMPPLALKFVYIVEPDIANVQSQNQLTCMLHWTALHRNKETKTIPNGRNAIKQEKIFNNNNQTDTAQEKESQEKPDQKIFYC